MSKQAMAKKGEEVQVLVEKMQSVNSFVILDYSGLSVAQVTQLRRDLRANGCEMKVIKNNITKRAAAAAGYSELADSLKGPNAVAFSTEDSVSAAKTIYEFAKTNKELELKVGVVDGEYMDNEKILQIATIPTRDALLTMIAGGILQPIKEVAMAIHMHVENLEESSQE